MSDYPRVLIVSRSAWRDDNSIGNTLSNMFGNWDKKKIANLYCRSELPENKVCENYFQITEKSLFRSMLKKNTEIGESFKLNQNNEEKYLKSKNKLKESENEKKIYDLFKKFRSNFFLFGRESLWKLGKWRNNNINRFLNDFEPDIIFMEVNDSFYMQDILLYAQRITKAKVILFFTDDHCSYKQFIISPISWVKRFLFRKKMNKTLRFSSKNYAISEKLRDEYTNIFSEKFEMMYKSGEFNNKQNKSLELNSPLKIIYAGNITLGRWKTLGFIGRSLQDINRVTKKAELHIYTKNIMTKKVKEALDYKDSVQLKGSIPGSEVARVLESGDILLHVESFGFKDRLKTRLSFSTKLVDYFEHGKCIFAVGWKETASIEYLIKNNAAVTVTKNNDILTVLKDLIENLDKVNEFATKSWNCGKRNHDKKILQNSFYKDLKEISETVFYE